MIVMTATTAGDVLGYRACVDPLHRNTWPVRHGDDETVIGNLTEHITVNLDGNTPPMVAWSWKLTDDELARFNESSHRFIDWSIQMRPTYATWREALEVLARIHEICLIYAEVQGEHA